MVMVLYRAFNRPVAALAATYNTTSTMIASAATPATIIPTTTHRLQPAATGTGVVVGVGGGVVVVVVNALVLAIAVVVVVCPNATVKNNKSRCTPRSIPFAPGGFASP